MGQEISRRNVAKGAAWGVPALTIAAAAPSMAASGAAAVTVSSKVCNLFYGSGTINDQAHNIYFDFTSSTGTIPAGTVITHQVCVDPSTDPAGGTTWNIPTNNYPVGNGQTWNITYTDTAGNPLPSGTAMSGKQCFNVLYTFTGDTLTSNLGCVTGIIWSGSGTFRPASTVTVSTDTAVSGPTGVSSGGAGSLSYKASKRYPANVNNQTRLPHYFNAKSGVQTCYPSVSSSQALTSDGFDDVVCYPSGTAITTARCNWGPTFCTANANGLCTPPQKTGVAGQTDIPAMC